MSGDGKVINEVVCPLALGLRGELSDTGPTVTKGEEFLLFRTPRIERSVLLLSSLLCCCWRCQGGELYTAASEVRWSRTSHLTVARAVASASSSAAAAAEKEGESILFEAVGKIGAAVERVTEAF